MSHNDKITAFLYVTKIQHGFMVSKDVHVFFNKFYSIFFQLLFIYLREVVQAFYLQFYVQVSAG